MTFEADKPLQLSQSPITPTHHAWSCPANPRPSGTATAESETVVTFLTCLGIGRETVGSSRTGIGKSRKKSEEVGSQSGAVTASHTPQPVKQHPSKKDDAN